jgi:TatD DNase family protein
MFPHKLTDTRAFDVAQAMLDGFNRHYRLFSETNRAAKRRFEQADWHGQQRAQRERIEFYDMRVAEAVDRLQREFNTASLADQVASLAVHADVARAHGLPLVIHTREAEAATIAELKRHAGIPFVLHCFSGSAWLAEEALALGGYISFSGILTFKRSVALRCIAAQLPHSRVLVETDAPYLAPEPVRHLKRCTPAMVTHTAKVLAEAWQISPAAVAEINTANCLALFPRLQARGFLAS